MKKNHFTSFVLLLCAQAAVASPVGLEEAMQVAYGFCRSHSASMGAPADFDLTLAYVPGGVSRDGVYSAPVDTYPSFYVFNKSENNGFIIVSGESETREVLGYSDNGAFDINTAPCNFKAWLDAYDASVKNIRLNGAVGAVRAEAGESGDYPDAVAPLLGNITWGQEDPYNMLCPMDNRAGKLSATGCVATAIAQIMKYYEWPAKGKGSNTYISDDLGIELSSVFSRHNYDWTNMTDTYDKNSTEEQKQAVALLMSDIGIACNMNYSATASGCQSTEAGLALKDHFYYNNAIQIYEREYFTTEEWHDMLKKELSESRPVYYSAVSMGGGHAFVCDGYDSDNLFHINWGWDGNSNGYFDVTVMDPYSQGVGAGSGGYSMEQYILTDVQKSTGDDPEPAEVIRLTMPLTTNVTTVQKGQNFTIGFGMRNYGLQEMMPRFGFALYQGDTQLSVLASNEFGTGLAWGFGHNELTLDVSIPTSTEDGDYRIYPVYRNRNMGDWHIYKGKVGCRDYLDLTVSGNDVTIHSGETGYSLVLDGDLEYTKLYAGSAAQFSLKLKNEGTEEYVGVLAIYAQSPSLGNGYFLREGIVVKPGEVLDLTKSTRIGCPAGTYTMRVLYDRDRTGVLYDLTNSQSVDVKNPTDVTLRLLDDVAPVNAEIERGDELEINVNIKSEGGVYYNRLLAFVFDEDKNNVFTFYRDVFLEEDEETDVVLSSVLNLEPGKYEVDIWGLKPTNNNEYLRPTGGSHICKFTVLGSGVDEVADAVSVYPNPAVDVVNVENAGGIDRITIYSLEGRLCMDVVAGGEKSTDISVAGLPSGTYILKVENQDGVFTDKLIKK